MTCTFTVTENEQSTMSQVKPNGNKRTILRRKYKNG